jgi:hypothetical protein
MMNELVEHCFGAHMRRTFFILSLSLSLSLMGVVALLAFTSLLQSKCEYNNMDIVSYSIDQSVVLNGRSPDLPSETSLLDFLRFVNISAWFHQREMIILIFIEGKICVIINGKVKY